VLVLLALLVSSQGNLESNDVLSLILILVSGGIGGFLGGLLAGLFTMLALRPNAPSISWKHMSPTIRIWGISGPLGMIVSGLITAVMIAIGAIGSQGAEPDCSGVGFGDCLGQIIGSALGEFIGLVILILLVFLLLVIAAWFLTGMFAGWLAVRHIRRLGMRCDRRSGGDDFSDRDSYQCPGTIAIRAGSFPRGFVIQWDELSLL